MCRPIKFIHLWITLLSTVIAATLTGCGLFNPPLAENPTEVSQGIIKTFGAQLTETALFTTPSNTPTNTALPPTATITTTPTETATITQTHTPRPTLTPLPPRTGCQVLSIEPRAKTRMGPRNDFDAIWILKNTGFEDWDPEEVDFRYIRGYQFQKRHDVFTLPDTVEPQETIEIRIDMVAPAEAGEYTALWGLMHEDGWLLCAVLMDFIIE